jgi:hypothetical protein
MRWGTPPLTDAVVKSLYATVFRSIRRDLNGEIDDLFRGRGTQDGAVTYWKIAAIAYLALVPIGLVLSIAILATQSAVLGHRPGDIAAVPSAMVLSIPPVGALYAYLIGAATAGGKRRYVPHWWYSMHDLAIAIVALPLAVVVVVAT